MRQGVEALIAISVATCYPVIEDCISLGEWVGCKVLENIQGRTASNSSNSNSSSSWSMHNVTEALIAMSVAKRYPLIEDCMPWVG
jgi:hypothetical protein